MARYQATTKRPPGEVVDRAIEMFGEQLGLTVLSSGANGASFEGGGGAVQVSVETTDGTTDLEIETREWDIQVRKFLESL